MEILLHEFITGGGLWGLDGSQSANSLVTEATAMVRAVCRDLSRIPGTRVFRLEDTRFRSAVEPTATVIPVSSALDEFRQLDHWSPRVDGVIVIAPEFDGHLTDRCRRIQAVGGRLLSPGFEFVQLASNKHRTLEILQRAGVPTPQGQCVQPGEALPRDLAYPAILKPNDGVGSLHVRLLHKASDDDPQWRPNGLARLEQFCPGQAASVAALCGPAGHRLLPACWQRISQDGTFQYLGGQLPLETALADRAARLADATLEALPATCGFVGIDMILGTDDNESADRVLEVNPRVTTSYVGLQAACTTNLGKSMIAWALGETTPLSFRTESIRFEANGAFTLTHGDQST